MKYVHIPPISAPVSRLVLGTSGGIFAGGGDIDEVMDAALDCGINILDTARVYGRSEDTIGRWLSAAPGRRERVIILTKGCHPAKDGVLRVNPTEIEADLRRSLDALRTDHVDFYLLHRDDPDQPVEVIVDCLNRFREEGLITAFGGSNWTAARIEAANAYAARAGLVGFALSSPHYSLGVQRNDPWGYHCVTLTGGAMAEERAWYARTQLPALAWSSLCSGVFSGKLRAADWPQLEERFGRQIEWAYGGEENRGRLARCEELAERTGATVSQLVTAWLLADPMNVLPIIGASSAARVRENAAAADLVLTPGDWAWLAGEPSV